MSELTLDAVIRSMPPKAAAPSFPLDVSRFFPALAAKEPVLFTFRCIDLNDIYGVSETAEIIHRQKPEWDEKLCNDLAGIARCHIAPLPEGGNKAMIPLLYANFLANADDIEAFILIQEFNALAGADFLRRLGNAVESRKKNSETPPEDKPDSESSAPASNTPEGDTPKS